MFVEFKDIENMAIDAIIPESFGITGHREKVVKLSDLRAKLLASEHARCGDCASFEKPACPRVVASDDDNVFSWVTERAKICEEFKPEVHDESPV